MPSDVQVASREGHHPRRRLSAPFSLNGEQPGEGDPAVKAEERSVPLQRGFRPHRNWGVSWLLVGIGSRAAVSRSFRTWTTVPTREWFMKRQVIADGETIKITLRVQRGVGKAPFRAVFIASLVLATIRALVKMFSTSGRLWEPKCSVVLGSSYTVTAVCIRGKRPTAASFCRARRGSRWPRFL